MPGPLYERLDARDDVLLVGAWDGDMLRPVADSEEVAAQFLRKEDDSRSRTLDRNHRARRRIVLVAPDDPLIGRVRRSELPSGLPYDALKRIAALRSRTHLHVMLGRRGTGEPTVELFAQLGEKARLVRTWDGRELPAAEFVDLTLLEPANPDFAGRFRMRHQSDAGALLEYMARQRSPGTRGLVLLGRPGSGKSVLLRKLHASLLVGAWRWFGPSIRLDARRLRGGADLRAGMQAQLAPSLPVADLLDADAMRGSVWLLLDGLDELPAAERVAVLDQVREWPGPFVVASRQVPERLVGVSELEVADLDDVQAAQVGMRPTPGRPRSSLAMVCGEVL